MEARQGVGVLGAHQLREAMVAFEVALRLHRDALNRLNVYPVPDGDTGTNMGLTAEAVIAALPAEGAGGADDTAATCKAIAHGSLMGARGNSGVILCQILRGMVGTFARAGAVDAGVMSKALEEASNA